MAVTSGLGIQIGAPILFLATIDTTIAAPAPAPVASCSVSIREQNLRDVISSQTPIVYCDTSVVGSVTQSGGLVSALTDPILGLSFTASGSARGLYTASDSEFKGRPSIAGDGANVIMSAAIDRPPPGTTPTWILCVMRQLGYGSTRSLWGTASNTFCCNQGSSSGTLLLRNMTAGPATTAAHAPVGTSGNVRALQAYYNNNTTDYIQVGSNTAVSGTNVGNIDPGGTFSLFARTGGASNGANVALSLFLMLPGIPTEITNILAYCNDKFGSPT